MSHATQLPKCRSLPDDREIINRPGLPGHSKSTGGQDRQGAVTTTVKSALEHRLEEECPPYLGCARDAPRPWGRRPA
jgi:hypothetical protein